MFGFLLFAILLSLGFFAGRATERDHFRALDQAEDELSSILGTNLKTPPANAGATVLVTGNVVVALDYFKLFTSKIRMQ